MLAYVALMICCRSCAAWEFLALPIMPCRAQLADACITLLAWVMVGLVMR
jgi:hypothetical protein